MSYERLKALLYNALVQFANDEYSKETALCDLGMTEEEFDELTADKEIKFVVYD